MYNGSKTYSEAVSQPRDEVLDKFLIWICLQEMMPVLCLEWRGNVLGRGGKDSVIRDMNNVFLPQWEPIFI